MDQNIFRTNLVQILLLNCLNPKTIFALIIPIFVHDLINVLENLFISINSIVLFKIQEWVLFVIRYISTKNISSKYLHKNPIHCTELFKL